jgi:hypothetical protein
VTQVAPLDATSLIEQSARARGSQLSRLAPFPQDELAGPLALLLDDLNGTARLTARGRDLTDSYLTRLIMVRRQLDAVAIDQAEVVHSRVEAPVFVVGAPRTGTTVVHRLLAHVPGMRAPEGWELLYPLPSPVPGQDSEDPRIDWAGEELTAPQNISGDLLTIHSYSARMPKECLSAMSFALRSEEFISRYDVPTYREWLTDCDMAPAYGIHRNVLAALQRNRPADRWVLKSPVHLQNLPTLMATYPDARLLITHRDPLPMLSSVSSLVATMRSAFSNDVDPVAIGRYHLDLYSQSLSDLSGFLDSGLLPDNRVVHIHHTEIVQDPVGVVCDVLELLSVPVTETTRVELSRLAAEDRADSLGAHRHDPTEFGLDPNVVRDRFDGYIERFLTGEPA